jgi:flagellar motor switch protein FliN/FliY
MTTALTSDHSADAATMVAAMRTAATAAGGLLPADIALSTGEPVTDPERTPLPAGAGTAVAARLAGEVSGDMVLVLSEEIVTALTNSPVGPMDVASAVRPALDAAAAALGRVRVNAERVEDAVSALDGLRDKGVFLSVPLTSGDVIVATLAVQVTLPDTRERRASLDLLRNVSMEVTVEIGRTRMTVQELLSLYPGEVIELDRAASAPADLLVNGTLIARGEIVVVDEDFGLRISEIVTDATEFGPA